MEKGTIQSTTELTKDDRGRWVRYLPTGEVGRLKSWNGLYVFIVYNCDDNWGKFFNYTAASTHPTSIEFIEKPDDIKKD